MAGDSTSQQHQEDYAKIDQQNASNANSAAEKAEFQNPLANGTAQYADGLAEEQQTQLAKEDWSNGDYTGAASAELTAESDALAGTKVSAASTGTLQGGAVAGAAGIGATLTGTVANILNPDCQPSLPDSGKFLDLVSPLLENIASLVACFSSGSATSGTSQNDQTETSDTDNISLSAADVVSAEQTVGLNNAETIATAGLTLSPDLDTDGSGAATIDLGSATIPQETETATATLAPIPTASVDSTTDLGSETIPQETETATLSPIPTVSVDSNGNESITTTDGQGNSLTVDEDSAGNITGSSATGVAQETTAGDGSFATATDALGDSATTTYDPNGNLSGITVSNEDNAGDTFTTNYDASGNQVSTTIEDSDGNVITPQQATNDEAYAAGVGGGCGHGYWPVIINLNGKGVGVTTLGQSNTYLDMSGSGFLSRTAWAAPGNAVLFYDPNNTNQITQANQIIFTDWDPSC